MSKGASFHQIAVGKVIQHHRIRFFYALRILFWFVVHTNIESTRLSKLSMAVDATKVPIKFYQLPTSAQWASREVTTAHPQPAFVGDEFANLLVCPTSWGVVPFSEVAAKHLFDNFIWKRQS